LNDGGAAAAAAADDDTVFLLLLGGYHRDMKITKNSSAFSMLLALSELKS
jgi:hypothetical protein